MRHGFWCGARTIPFRCRYCGTNPIFWFSCNCGCSVLWDDLGWPWPKHRCHRPRSAEVVEVEDEVVEDARRPWLPRDMVARRAERSNQRARAEGVVADLHPERNAHRKFRVPDTAVGSALLGPLGGGGMGQVTLHCLRAAESGRPPIRESVTAWGPTAQLRGLERREAVRVGLRSHRIKEETVWILESLAPLFLEEVGDD